MVEGTTRGIIASFLTGLLAGMVLMMFMLGALELTAPALEQKHDVYHFKVLAISSSVAVEGTFETELPINPNEQWAMVFVKNEAEK